MDRFIRQKYLIFGLFTAIFFSGCSSELDPRNPGDAYLMFRDAMFAGDSDAVWQRVDPETHEFFNKSYVELEGMGETIERYLPQADHRLAKNQSGVKLLKETTDGKSLFVRVFTPEQLPKEEAFKLGSDIAELKMSEDEQFAEVVTKGGQTFFLVHNEKDEQWYVMLLKSSEEMGKAMAWVEANKSALSQTVDDLIAEERTEREKIIAELMGFKPKE